METLTLKDVPVRLLVDIVELIREEQRDKGLDEEMARFKSSLQTVIMFNRENGTCPQTVVYMGPHQGIDSYAEGDHSQCCSDPAEDIAKVLLHAKQMNIALRGMDSALQLLTDAALRAKYNV